MEDRCRDHEEAALGDRTNMIFSGTAATYGRGCAVFTATGMQTQMGRIAGMLETAPNKATPLQQEPDRVGKPLGIIIVVLVEYPSKSVSMRTRDAARRDSI